MGGGIPGRRFGGGHEGARGGEDSILSTRAAGLFLEDFGDRRESFINPVNNREEAQRGMWTNVVEDNWRRDVWVGSSRFWVRPRRHCGHGPRETRRDG